VKRSTPLRRGGSLKRHTPLEGGASLARRTPIRQQSAKRQQENRERGAMVRQLWPEPPMCVVTGCPRLADDVHEPLTRARGGSITDPKNAVAICRPHHDELTFGEPDWAYEQGLKFHSWDKREAS
jgi:hypothetical protein